MSERGFHFEEESRLVSSSGGALPQEAAAAGSACGRAALCACGENERARVFVSHGSGEGAASLAHAFGAGVSSAGADCVFGGECCAPAASYAAKELDCGICCHVHTEITSSLLLTASDGLPLYRSAEKRIEQFMKSPKELPYSHYGSIESYDDASMLYSSWVSRMLTAPMKGIYADVYSSSPSVMRVCEKILEKKGCRNGERIAFRISSDGKRISAYSEETGYVFRDKLIMLCCRRLFEKGMDAAVCGRSPRALEKLALRYGRRVISCGKSVCINENSPSGSCLKARKAASKQPFMYDGIALMMTVLDILSTEGVSLGDAVSSLPDFADINRFIPIDKPSELLERLCITGCEENGLVSDGESGRVTIRPVRTGKGVMLNVEAAAAETAAELCDFYADIIKSGQYRV